MVDLSRPVVGTRTAGIGTTAPSRRVPVKDRTPPLPDIKRTPTRARAREAPGYSLNSRDFRRARRPQARLTECFHMYRLHTKKRPSVARHKRCVACHVDRPRVRSKNVYRGAGSGASTDALREIGAPCREIGVELDVYP